MEGSTNPVSSKFSIGEELSPAISLKSVLKYSSPYSGLVIDRDIDKHIRQSIGSAMVEPMLAFAVLAFCLSFVFYALFLSHSHIAGLWMAINVGNLLLCIAMFFLYRRARQRQWFENGRFYWVQLAPILSASLCWGLMPHVAGYQNETEFYFAALTLVGITYIHIFWLPGVFIFNALYAVISHSYLFMAIYQNNGDTSSWIVLTLAGVGSVAMAGIFVAYWRITNAAQQYRLERQAALINGLYAQYQLNSTDWVWETCPDHGINYISADVLGAGLDETDVNGRTHFARYFVEDDPNTVALCRYLANHHAFERLIIPNQSADKKRYFELRGKPQFDDENHFLGFRGFGRDITESQQYEQLKVSGEKFEMISKFVAKIAHDINNSLMVIQSSIDFLQVTASKDSSSTDDEVYATISSVVKSASNVTNELLGYTRQEVLHPRYINLAEFTSASVQKLRTAMPDIHFDITINTSILVYADPIALQRTFDNIVNNAKDAMDAQGLISIHAHYVDQGQGGKVSVCFKDTGKGFSREALHRAGEPFYTNKRKMGGSGLGMATAIGFAKQSGGELSWENCKGGGAMVCLHLPSKKGCLQIDKPDVALEAVDLTQLSILVVDDNIPVVERLSRQFRSLGMNVELATTYDEAITRVNTSGIAFDVFLIDVRLDGDTRSGPDLADVLADGHAKVIMMTGYSELLEQLSTHTVMSKPFSTAEFVLTINGLLQCREHKHLSYEKHPNTTTAPRALARDTP